MALAEAVARGIPVVSTDRGRYSRNRAREREHPGQARRQPGARESPCEPHGRPDGPRGARATRATCERAAAELERGRGAFRDCPRGTRDGRVLTGFTPDWLRLREPLDSASRDGSLVEWLPHVTGTRQVVDLGAGTGANLRFLAPLLGGAQEWLLVDDDAGVLEAADPAFSDWASNTGARMTSGPAELLITAAGFECRVRRRRLDLAAELRTAAAFGSWPRDLLRPARSRIGDLVACPR